MDDSLQKFIRKHTPAIEERLNTLLETETSSLTLRDAMAYSVNAGGKRIRPLLVLATLHDLDVSSEDAITVACAVELIHTYSLIHDDLPSMDDDDFRRGKPTNHTIYGEAVAILAGDALQTLAFGCLTKLSSTPAEVVLQIIHLLAEASGLRGMVGGQVLDLEGETKQLSLLELETVHINKTGALLSFCIEAGALIAGADAVKTDKLKTFAHNIGLAFQIRDDILDVTSTTEELGKTVGSDETSDKSTYPSLLGLADAEKRLKSHQQLAKSALSILEKEESLLGLFADYIVERKS
ncbi:polyprenyl synthetase family protein [Filibacter tadaridae]|nr:farnesyl diphosphate synthase [Filibacter tadaridae]